MPETKQLSVVEDSPSFWRVILNNPPINLLDPYTIRELQQLIATIQTTKHSRAQAALPGRSPESSGSGQPDLRASQCASERL